MKHRAKMGNRMRSTVVMRGTRLSTMMTNAEIAPPRNTLATMAYDAVSVPNAENMKASVNPKNAPMHRGV